MKKLMAHPFVKGMVKALDIAGSYDVRGRSVSSRSTADDLRTPTVRDDIRRMRGDVAAVGNDMRTVLKRRGLSQQ